MRKTSGRPRKKQRKKSNFDSICLTIPSFGASVWILFCTNLFTVLHREQEIRAAEERLMQNDAPRTADEFEKLVRGSLIAAFYG